MEISELHKVLSYDPTTGKITWRQDRIGANGGIRAKAGTEAGSRNKIIGYQYLYISGWRQLSHRAAWALHYGAWPAGDIDHINMDKSDNRIDNLRLASRSRNMMNRGPTKLNKLNAKGVERTRAGHYTANIMVNYTRYYLGTFDTVAEASAAYDTAAKIMHGDFFRSSSTLSRVSKPAVAKPAKTAKV